MKAACYLAAFLPLTLGASPAITLNTTTIDLNGGASGWVRASVTLSSPGTSGLFLAVYTPSTANVTPVPPQPYPDEGPWTAQAAQKWVSCPSIPGCMGGTTFSYNFSIVNSYSDTIIHAFNGGENTPTLVASSPPITFTTPNAPTRGHLGRTPVLSEMNVTWWTPEIGVAGGAVKWGASPTSLANTAPAWSSTYTKEDMCGAPANGRGWQDPHFWLTATISSLTPGSTTPVYYSYGSDAGGWSAPLSFIPAPAPGADQTVRLLLLADNGVTEEDGTIDHWDEPIASLTVSRMRDWAQSGTGYDYSLIVHPGDISYGTGLLAKWPTFTARWNGLNDRVAYWIGHGNHERDMPGSGMEPSPFSHSMDSGGECGKVTNTIYPQSVEWRSLVQGNVFLLMLNSELSVAQYSPQWNYTRDALAGVDKSVTPWLVVAFHRPLYYVAAGGAGGSRDENFAPLEPLLVEAGVHAVLVGHVHNTFVSCPVNNSVCGKGPVHVCIGNAGQGLTPIQAKVPSWVVYQNSTYGYATLVATKSSMQISLYQDSDNQLLYTANFSPSA